MSQNRDIIPFEFTIEPIYSLVPGTTVTVDIVKTGGSEEMRGFDFMIGYQDPKISIVDINPGPIFDIPGTYEWEYLDYPPPPYENCFSGCPTGMFSIRAIADISNGAHHPLNDPGTGRIKIIPNGTVLISLDFEIDPFIDPELTAMPIYFFFNSCASNGIAFTYTTSSILDIKQANSDTVYDFDGLGYINITDTTASVPTTDGIPGLCLPMCGDVNQDRITNILDIIVIVKYKYMDGDPPYPLISADVNGDLVIDILDLVYYINYKFKNGPELACPSANVRLTNFKNGGIFAAPQ